MKFILLLLFSKYFRLSTTETHLRLFLSATRSESHLNWSADRHNKHPGSSRNVSTGYFHDKICSEDFESYRLPTHRDLEESPST